jgi:hypothetical protein
MHSTIKDPRPKRLPDRPKTAPTAEEQSSTEDPLVSGLILRVTVSSIHIPGECAT